LKNPENKNLPEYRIKAVVCFVGAHYFSFVKFYEDETHYWKIYNDE